MKIIFGIVSVLTVMTLGAVAQQEDATEAAQWRKEIDACPQSKLEMVDAWAQKRGEIRKLHWQELENRISAARACSIALGDTQVVLFPKSSP